MAMAEDYASALGSAVGTDACYDPPHSQARRAAPVDAVADELPPPESAVMHDLTPFIEGMRSGNERALEALYDATVGKLYALASALLRSVEDAEEVVCETYAYAWANAVRYDAGRANVLGWLLMLCRSRALDRLRQRRAGITTVDMAALEGVEADPAEQPYDILSLMQQRSTVYSALSKLTPQRRRLVALAFLRGLSHHQIAQVTGLPLGTIKSHVRRALAQLREALEET